jgi:diacylglycerol kinase (ATP)
LRLAIIANPVSGRGRPFRRLQRWIGAWPHPDWQVEVFATRAPEHATVIARDLLANPPDLVAVCSGDGTFREVACGVPDPPFPVAPLPGGTANVLAHELGISMDPVAALEGALKGNVRRVDLGMLQTRQQSRFLLFVGAGFDAYVAARVRPQAKARIGIAAYYLETVRSLLAYDFPCFEVVTEGESVAATSCLAASSHCYGGGLSLVPAADMCDGYLDLFLVTSRSRFDYFRFLMKARLGWPPEYPWIRRLRARSVRITGPRGIWVQADGDLAGSLPVEVGMLPAAFPLMVPAASQ